MPQGFFDLLRLYSGGNGQPVSDETPTAPAAATVGWVKSPDMNDGIGISVIRIKDCDRFSKIIPRRSLPGLNPKVS